MGACARAPLKPQTALRKTSAPTLKDDLPLPPLLEAIQNQISFIEKTPATETFTFGTEVYNEVEYLTGLRRVLELARDNPDPANLFPKIEQEFDFYEVYGRENWGEVFITSYFEPVISGSKKPTLTHSLPLYSAPPDLVTVDLADFDPKFEGERKLRGRVVEKFFVPYFSRTQIDSLNALKNRKLELCWVDPIDGYFLQVQGSGTVDLGKGERLHLNYAESNGHKYDSLGNHLRAFIPAEQLNLHTIEAYLRKLSAVEIQDYLNRNASYVFFKSTAQTALTFLGVPATDGRTIATDRKYFPKGALAFILFPKPVFESPDQLVPTRTEETSRFVLDQDIGGAITGGGRVDLFWGRGAEAKHYAGVMKYPGRLYYLAPKRNH
ncbi:MAG: hypothetical protein A2Z97_05440 [Bdellovibrionales bacterium GWB1_52_6]|nr:MAG: hypothetical protein A2Z97_05440 [Bdellovibrionales bacterium GWB1_52_6]